MVFLNILFQMPQITYSSLWKLSYQQKRGKFALCSAFVRVLLSSKDFGP